MNAVNTAFFFLELCPHLANRIADADAEHRLTGIFQNVDDLTRRGLEVDRLAVGQEMVFGISAADCLGQPLAELALQEAHNLANPLERETLAPELADHRDFGEVFHGVQPAMTLADW